MDDEARVPSPVGGRGQSRASLPREPGRAAEEDTLVHCRRGSMQEPPVFRAPARRALAPLLVEADLCAGY